MVAEDSNVRQAFKLVFRKNCEAPSSDPATAARDSLRLTSVSGLSIGTQAGGSEVVADGLTSDKFR